MGAPTNVLKCAVEIAAVIKTHDDCLVLTVLTCDVAKMWGLWWGKIRRLARLLFMRTARSFLIHPPPVSIHAEHCICFDKAIQTLNYRWRIRSGHLIRDTVLALPALLKHSLREGWDASAAVRHSFNSSPESSKQHVLSRSNDFLMVSSRTTRYWMTML